jgi:hypothetical protein
MLRSDEGAEARICECNEHSQAIKERSDYAQRSGVTITNKERSEASSLRELSSIKANPFSPRTKKPGPKGPQSQRLIAEQSSKTHKEQSSTKAKQKISRCSGYLCETGLINSQIAQ